MVSKLKGVEGKQSCEARGEMELVSLWVPDKLLLETNMGFGYFN